MSDQDQQHEEVQEMAKMIQGSWRWRIAFWHLQLAMFMESVAWTFMDLARAYRLRVAKKIAGGYKKRKK